MIMYTIKIANYLLYHMLFFYRIIGYLLLPLLLTRIYCKACKQSAYFRNIKDRFGFVAPIQRPDIWIHAVSVGEVGVARLLVAQLQTVIPKVRILITTTTPTGKDALGTLLSQATVSHCYFPFDLYGVMRRFMHRVQPSLAVVVETELWPNMLATARQHACPVILVNARLSAKSFTYYNKPLWRQFSSKVCNQLSVIIAQYPKDAERYRLLGYTGNIAISGNIKFDAPQPTITPNYRSTRSLVWLALSIRDGEQWQIMQAASLIRSQLSDALCVIIPRHLVFANALQECAIKQGLTVSIVSSSAALASVQSDVVIVKAMGIVSEIFGHVQSVFVGGSLVALGGHNVLEPIAAHKPVCIGENYFNFSAIVTDLRTKQAIQIIANATALAQKLLEFYRHPEAARAQAQRAYAFCKQHQGATQKVVEMLLPFIKDNNGKHR